jgi:photosystem II stability/assembly factor-like uncharacterized protein
MRFHFLLTLCLPLLVVSSFPLASLATAADPADLYEMLQWRNVGPDIGGRSIAVGGSTQRPFEYYFGATGGGLWKTTDGGGEWKSVTDGQIASSSVGAVAVDPVNPDIVYIGMGEGQLRGNVMQGDGVYKTTDGGKTWNHMGLEKTRTITTIRIHATKPNIVFAAALGDPFSSNSERGVYRSTNAGKTWKKVLFRSDEAGAIDLAMDPNNPDVLFATIWQVYRKPWKLWSGGPQSGMFKSTDGGDTWTEITGNPGLPTTVLGKMTVAVSPVDSQRVYANIEADQGGLYRSDDGGQTWEHVNGHRKLWQRSFYFMQVRPDPVDRDTVYILSFQLEKSTNAGETFRQITTRHVDIHDLWIDPENNQRMVVADDGGGSVSVNGGKTWTLQDYPTAQIYRVTTTNDFPYHVCGTQQDNRATVVPSRSGTGLSRFEEPYAPHYIVSGSEMGYIAPHPKNTDVFFVGATNQLTRYNRATNDYRDVFPYPYMVMGEPAEGMPERWSWNFPIVFSPEPPHALYAGSQHLWRTMDEGETWERISPDLTRADPATLGETGGPVRLDQDGPEVYATIYTIAPSELDEKVIWTGSDDGLVHVTIDGGGNWKNVTPPNLPVNSRVSYIDASPHHAGTAYVAAKRYEMGDRKPYLWKTTDYGKNWSFIVGDLNREDFTHTVRVDTVIPQILYAGTEHGVRVSFDDGKSWHSLSLNLPDTHVSGIEVKGNELVISTHGRSFYILEGLATLRQISDATIDKPVRLFEPAAAVRRIVPAQFDFYLSKDVKGANIQVLDSAGLHVRTLATGRTYKSGAHRVEWNLRHDGAVVFPRMILESPNPSSGPLAIPRNYIVRFEIGDQILEQPFELKSDPRLTDVTSVDFATQLAYALKVRDAITTANETVMEIRRLRDEIQNRLDGNSESLANFAKPFLTSSVNIESRLYQVKNESPKDKIAYPIQLNDRLSWLMGNVALSNAAPTKAQIQVFEQLSGQLGELMDQYRSTKEIDLKALNDELIRREIQPIEIVN